LALGVRPAHRRQHPGAECSGQLDRTRPDAVGATVHTDCLPSAQAAGRDEARPRSGRGPRRRRRRPRRRRRRPPRPQARGWV